MCTKTVHMAFCGIKMLFGGLFVEDTDDFPVQNAIGVFQSTEVSAHTAGIFLPGLCFRVHVYSQFYLSQKPPRLTVIFVVRA